MVPIVIRYVGRGIATLPSPVLFARNMSVNAETTRDHNLLT